MALIVQKYGGSSVADAEKIKNVARRVAAAKDKGDRVVPGLHPLAVGPRYIMVDERLLVLEYGVQLGGERDHRGQAGMDQPEATINPVPPVEGPHRDLAILEQLLVQLAQSELILSNNHVQKI